jgi:HAD superfamily hydrolase (TIGR01509 family)
MRPKLVIFDCDGVLVDSEPIAQRVEVRLLAKLGLALDETQTRALFKGKTVTEVAAVMERELGLKLEPSWIYEWAMSTAHELARDLREVPGVRAVIEAFAKAGVLSCVASQSLLPRVQLSLAVTGLDRYFPQRVYTASMVARGKPAPDLFLHAARQLGAEPSACVVIEDSPSGVRAGVAAGMTVLGYAAAEDEAALAAAGATVFFAMRDLPALLGIGLDV